MLVIGDWCSMTFVVYNEFKLHLISIHKKQTCFKCFRCLYTSQNVENVKKHFIKAHERKFMANIYLNLTNSCFWCKSKFKVSNPGSVWDNVVEKKNVVGTM